MNELVLRGGGGGRGDRADQRTCSYWHSTPVREEVPLRDLRAESPLFLATSWGVISFPSPPLRGRQCKSDVGKTARICVGA